MPSSWPLTTWVAGSETLYIWSLPAMSMKWVRCLKHNDNRYTSAQQTNSPTLTALASLLYLSHQEQISVWGCIHMTCNHSRMWLGQIWYEVEGSPLEPWVCNLYWWPYDRWWIRREAKKPQARFYRHLYNHRHTQNIYIFTARGEVYSKTQSSEYLCQWFMIDWVVNDQLALKISILMIISFITSVNNSTQQDLNFVALSLWSKIHRVSISLSSNLKHYFPKS